MLDNIDCSELPRHARLARARQGGRRGRQGAARFEFGRCRARVRKRRHARLSPGRARERVGEQRRVTVACRDGRYRGFRHKVRIGTQIGRGLVVGWGFRVFRIAL